jgi:hypothetical protein
MLHLSLHYNMLVIFVVTLLCMLYACNKVCQELYTELSYFMKAAKFQLCW